MKLNIACPSTGAQKWVEVDDEKKLRALYDNRGLRGGERERGEEEESGVGDARHGGEKWRRVLRKVAAGARAFRSGTFSEVF